MAKKFFDFSYKSADCYKLVKYYESTNSYGSSPNEN